MKRAFHSLETLALPGHPGRFLARVQKRLRLAGHLEIESGTRRNSRKRPPGMAPALVEPPRGPLPLQGGAEAPLTFERD